MPVIQKQIRINKKNNTVFKLYEQSFIDSPMLINKAINLVMNKRKFKIIEVPMPKPIYIEKVRVPASYLNFYIANKIVLLPTFNDKNDKKVIKRNNKKYEKFSDHIGFIPLVIISPSDRNLIAEGSDIRRKFIDSVISQSDKKYLENLINYNKILTQRNSLLKLIFKNKNFDKQTIQVYDSQLESIGEKIHLKRKMFLNDFIPVFKDKYKSISNNNEDVDIRYKTDLEFDKLSVLLQENIEKDMFLQYTSKGIHKDDLVFNINDYSVKKFGSQGQQKSLLIALKLAQFDFLKSQNKNNPILLLDDIFDKLDKNRVKQIINLVSANDFGQIFISDTDEERTIESIKEINNSNKIFKL